MVGRDGHADQTRSDSIELLEVPRCGQSRTLRVSLSIGGADLCSASKPYNEDDADGQQYAGEPEGDDCLAPVRAVARRLEDPDADAPSVEGPNERGGAAKAERAESRRPGEGAPKHVATGRFRAHAVDDASRCSDGQRATSSSADADARSQHDMPARSRIDGRTG
jgi:hypothetical protein